MADKPTLQQLVDAKGYPQPVAAMVMDDIAKHKTEQQILSGESVLPSKDDAQRHYDRMEAAAGRLKLGAADADTVRGIQDQLQDIQRRMSALESNTQPPADAPAPPPAQHGSNG